MNENEVDELFEAMHHEWTSEELEEFYRETQTDRE
jgi:hypothetical protein